MRTRPISQAVMLILVLTTLMLSPAAYAQDSSATTGGGSGGSSATTTSGGGGGSTVPLDCRSLFQDSSSSFDLCYEQGYANACFNKFTGEFQGCIRADRNECTEYNVYAANNTLCNVVPLTCESLLEDSSSYFDLCSDVGYTHVCFNKFTGVYQGCGKTDRDDCTEYNIYASQNIRCDVSDLSNLDTCADNDGGRAYYKMGAVKVCSSRIEGPGGGTVGCALHEDYCSGGDNLVEHYCEGNEYKSEFYTCPTGCMDGACIQEQSCASQGEMCAGIAGILCCAGYTCQMDGTYPDASGTCVKETQNRFRNAYWECYDRKESYEGGPTSCKSSETWQEYAEESCKGHCSSNADATATTDNVEEASPKCGVNTFKVWNPCSGERNIIYCEDSPYDSDCMCLKGERVPEYEEPACEEEKPCPTVTVQVKYMCVTKERVIKARLGEPFDLEAPQTAVIVDYNEMQVKLTAISAGKDITPKMWVAGEAADASGMRPDERPVAHLVITLPGSKKLVQVREETRATIASITGRIVASSAGDGGGATATTIGASVMPRSGAKAIRLRQGESAEVFGATITVEKLDKKQGVFVVSKKDIVPCAENTKCDDGTIKPCYQEGNVCVCEACDVTGLSLCKPAVCPNGENVECEWDGESCVCESCNIGYTPLCGNGICEEGEGMVCQGAGSGLGTAEEVCYISCPEDCGTIEEPGDCDGCVSGTRCLPYGSRRVVEDTAVFCDFEGEWQGQLAEGDACQNDYECETNSCASGKCMDLEREISGLREMFQKILDLFAKLFG